MLRSVTLNNICKVPVEYDNIFQGLGHGHIWGPCCLSHSPILYLHFLLFSELRLLFSSSFVLLWRQILNVQYILEKNLYIHIL